MIRALNDIHVMFDLGPDGGIHGGEIVAAGLPEDVVKVSKSITAQFLKPLLVNKTTATKKTRLESTLEK